jgi:flagellar protein FlaF
MSVQSYQKIAEKAENPRDTEYRLFGQVTRALIEIAAKDAVEPNALVDVLDWNRRMWGVLANACADSENQLPGPLRAQIISLSLWVSRHTTAVVLKQETIHPLIEVNRIIMQGLASQAEPELV